MLGPARAARPAERKAVAIQRRGAPDAPRSGFTDDDDLVFPHPVIASVLDPTQLRRRFKAVVKVARVRPVTFHGLRHSYAVAMAAAGTPMRSLMEFLGHADFGTTLRYADFAAGRDERGGVGGASVRVEYQTKYRTDRNSGQLSDREPRSRGDRRTLSTPGPELQTGGSRFEPWLPRSSRSSHSPLN